MPNDTATIRENVTAQLVSHSESQFMAFVSGVDPSNDLTMLIDADDMTAESNARVSKLWERSREDARKEAGFPDSPPPSNAVVQRVLDDSIQRLIAGLPEAGATIVDPRAIVVLNVGLAIVAAEDVEAYLAAYRELGADAVPSEGAMAYADAQREIERAEQERQGARVQ